MANNCKKCGSENNYNFELNIGLCNPCIGKELERLENGLTAKDKEIESGNLALVELARQNIMLREENDKLKKEAEDSAYIPNVNDIEP